MVMGKKCIRDFFEIPQKPKVKAIHAQRYGLKPGFFLCRELRVQKRFLALRKSTTKYTKRGKRGMTVKSKLQQWFSFRAFRGLNFIILMARNKSNFLAD